MVDQTWTDVAPFAPTSVDPQRIRLGVGRAAQVDLDEVAIFDSALGAADFAERTVAAEPTTVIEYGYDGHNLRRTKTVDGVETTYEWDQLFGVAQVAVERTGGEQRRYVYGAGLQQVGVDGEEYFLHQNAIGSTVAVTDDAGTVVATYDYDAFGNIASAVDWIANPGGFGPLADGTRLAPKIPFIAGGEFSISNLVATDSASAMRVRGEMATQLRDVPDGGQVVFRITD